MPLFPTPVLLRLWPAVHDARMKLLRFLVPALLLSVFGFGFTGCTSTTVQSAGVGVSLIGISTGEGSEVVFQIQLQNENLVALALANSSYKVTLDGVAYGEAVVDKPMALVERTAVTVDAKLVVRDAATLERLRAVLADGAVDYTLACRLVSMIGDDRLVLLTKASGRYEAR